MNLVEILKFSEEYLKKYSFSKPRLEAEKLVSYVLNLDRIALYILGEWEFYGLPFKVSEGVLIPRADTEILVEQCIQLMRDIEEPNILDIGTGSGAISIAIANELKSSSVTGIDINEKALKLANENKILNILWNLIYLRNLIKILNMI